MVRSQLIPLVIAGPTASGKSSLAIKLAQKHQGEIICADSRQFYSYMAIGTASPTKADMAIVPHHGYGIIDPKVEKIDAGFFVSFAHQKISEIQSRNKRPILVGGTGLYLRSLYYGLGDIPPSDEKIAKDLSDRCEKQGLDALYQELSKIDPDSALNIMAQDRYRILRALEIFYTTNQKPSDLRASFKSKKPAISAHWIYKKPPKESLLVNIEKRVKEMFAEGLLDEAKNLAEYLPEGHWARKVMGYEEALLFLNKEITIAEALEKTIIRHRQYAKRQYTWFNKESFYRLIL
jgi:tRNA dimethylallyltransferase